MNGKWTSFCSIAFFKIPKETTIIGRLLVFCCRSTNVSSRFIFQNSTVCCYRLRRSCYKHSSSIVAHNKIFWKILSPNKQTSSATSYTLLYTVDVSVLPIKFNWTLLVVQLDIRTEFDFYHFVRSVCMFCHQQKCLCFLLYWVLATHALQLINWRRKNNFEKNSFVIVLSSRAQLFLMEFIVWLNDGRLKKQYITILIRPTLKWLNFDFLHRLLSDTVNCNSLINCLKISHFLELNHWTE